MDRAPILLSSGLSTRDPFEDGGRSGRSTDAIDLLSSASSAITGTADNPRQSKLPRPGNHENDDWPGRPRQVIITADSDRISRARGSWKYTERPVTSQGSYIKDPHTGLQAIEYFHLPCLRHMLR